MYYLSKFKKNVLIFSLYLIFLLFYFSLKNSKILNSFVQKNLKKKIQTWKMKKKCSKKIFFSFFFIFVLFI